MSESRRSCFLSQKIAHFLSNQGCYFIGSFVVQSTESQRRVVIHDLTFNGSQGPQTTWIRRCVDHDASRAALTVAIVDRILRQQKTERHVAEDAARTKVENTALISKPLPEIHSQPPPPPPVPPKLPGSSDSVAEKSSANSQLDLVIPRPRSASAMIQNWKLKFEIADSHHSDNAGPPLPVPNASLGPSGGPRSNDSVVTPQSNICEYLCWRSSCCLTNRVLASNIDMAIRACTQEQGHLLRNRDHMQMVKESLDEGYCDISGRVGDLDFIRALHCQSPVFVSTYV
jgi:hypothetical protein